MKHPVARFLAPAVAALLFGLALWILQRELQDYEFADLVRELHSLPPARILLALAVTAVSYALMSGYDVLALRYVGRPLAIHRVALASFVSYAASQNLGFPLLTGAPLRYRLYSRWGVTGAEVAQIVAFYTVTFWLGLLAIGGISFLADPVTIPPSFGVRLPSLRPLGALLLGVLAGYFALTFLPGREIRLGRWRLVLPSPGLAAAQVLLSSVDWALAAAVLYVILPGGAIGYPELIGIYLLGQLAGQISHVPGGVGVFETTLLVFLSPSLPAPAILGALLVYRGIYYLLPLALAALTLAVYEARVWAETPVRSVQSSDWALSLVAQVMALTVFAAGATLLLSGATPSPDGRIAWLNRILPLGFIEVSHLLASIAGAGLLLVARGLQLRMNAAYRAAATLLGAGAVFALVRGLGYEEATVLAFVLAAVVAGRHAFSRPSALWTERLTPGWIAAIGTVFLATVWLGFFSFKGAGIDAGTWWQFAPGADAPRFLRGTLAAVIFTCAAGAVRLFRPVPGAPMLPASSELDRAAEVVARSLRAEASLALLGDQALLWSERRNAFLMIRMRGRSWIALGEPVGEPDERAELLWRFRELCDAHAAWPVVYNVGAASLPLCLDIGLTPFRLGEQARVALAGVSSNLASRRCIREPIRRLGRQGYTFEVVPATAAGELLPELRAVAGGRPAAAWMHPAVPARALASENYLRRFPLALVRRNGSIAAWASVWPGAGQEELAIDGIRYDPAAPGGIEDYLLARVMLWGATQQFCWFDVGLSPAFSTGDDRLGSLWNAAWGFVFHRRERSGNQARPPRFGEQFGPVWEPRFLVAPTGLALPRILDDVSALTAEGSTGMARSSNGSEPRAHGDRGPVDPAAVVARAPTQNG